MIIVFYFTKYIDSVFFVRIISGKWYQAVVNASMNLSVKENMQSTSAAMHYSHP